MLRTLFEIARTAVPLAGLMCAPTSAQCEWRPVGFGGADDTVFAFAEFDGGLGSLLFAGGRFEVIGGVESPYLAAWDGREWTALPPGLTEPVSALHVHNDGSEAMLYIAGGIGANHRGTGHITRWDGNQWRQMPGRNGGIWTMLTHDDGSGAALYAGGGFTGRQTGDEDTLRIAKFAEGEWSAVGGGFDDTVWDLALFDDGSGKALFAGGSFRRADGWAVYYVAKWDGGQWSALDGGTSEPVNALAAFDDGSGPALYVGGSFNAAGGDYAIRGIARWDGEAWSDVGGGIERGTVWSLAVFDDGSGPALYAAGDFDEMGGIEARGIARWDGTVWSGLGGGVHTGYQERVRTLGPFNHGEGPALYVGGDFRNPGFDIARWVCGGCFGDTDQNGVVDTRDFLEFLRRWSAGDPLTDWNGDGQIDVQDFLLFLDDWVAGC